MSREVHFGSKPLAAGLATHWAIQVGSTPKPTWYEIPGASVKDKGAKNIIQKSFGSVAGSGAGRSETRRRTPDPEVKRNLRGFVQTSRSSQLGTTKRTDDDIEEFNEKWVKANPEYNIASSNCQRFVRDLWKFLIEDGYALYLLPDLESPLS